MCYCKGRIDQIIGIYCHLMFKKIKTSNSEQIVVVLGNLDNFFRNMYSAELKFLLSCFNGV